MIVFTALLDWVVWDRAPPLLEAAGMLVVIAGGVIAVTHARPASRAKPVQA